MTCRDCVHFDLCRDSGFLMYSSMKAGEFTEFGERKCPFKKFKNKTDFVEVVRCKDCKYNDNGDCIHPDNITHSYDSDWNKYDHYIGIYSDHYCSYGERRTDNDSL